MATRFILGRDYIIIVSATVPCKTFDAQKEFIYPLSPGGEKGHRSISSKLLCPLQPFPLHSFQVLNPSCALSFKTVLLHVSLGRPLLRLPSGAHVNTSLGFIFGNILRTCPSHFHLLDLTNLSY